MSLRAAAAAAVLASLLALEACKTPPSAAPSPDAAASSSAAAAPDASAPRIDPTLRVVALGGFDLTVRKTDDGRIAVVSGSIPYEAKADGSLEPVVGVDALAPVLADGEALVGYPEPWSPLPPDKLQPYLPAMSKTGDAAPAPARVSRRGCGPIPSFDGSAVVACRSKGGATIERLGGDGSERVFPDAPADFSAASIGKDGALYLAFANDLAVRRCPAPRGACTTIAVGEIGDLATIEYEAAFSDVIDPESNRSWQGLRVTSMNLPKPAGGDAIFARGEDDVWLVARASGRTVLLHAGAQRPLVQLPSTTDARVLVRNAKPPQLWTGHCEHVFVRLGSRDADALAKRAPEIQRALGSAPNAWDAPLQWALVEGRLHEDHVIGVVVVHRDPEEKLDKMERAIDRLVSAFATSPTSRPQATCTLPVLERRLVPAPTP